MGARYVVIAMRSPPFVSCDCRSARRSRRHAALTSFALRADTVELTLRFCAPPAQCDDGSYRVEWALCESTDPGDVMGGVDFDNCENIGTSYHGAARTSARQRRSSALRGPPRLRRRLSARTQTATPAPTTTRCRQIFQAPRMCAVLMEGAS
eukprot:COSAG06_NODE_1994_length_7889_cov_8.566752_2_plen_152_part_00